MALTIPIRINLIAPKTIEFIPGIGKRTAGDIILRRPLSEISTLLEISPSLDSRIIPHITFGTDIHSV
jgi:radical SAM superfamily enzyme with C-terminal helix-hairpin-helix motif